MPPLPPLPLPLPPLSSPFGIFGVGVDITYVSRFISLYQRNGEDFLSIFTTKSLHKNERKIFYEKFEKDKQMNTLENYNNNNNNVPINESSHPSLSPFPPSTSPSPVSPPSFTFLASRWSCKESLVKASGKRFLFSEIEIKREEKNQPDKNEDPRPKVIFEGEAYRWTKENQIISHISISHDGDIVMAFCTLEGKRKSY